MRLFVYVTPYGPVEYVRDRVVRRTVRNVLYESGIIPDLIAVAHDGRRVARSVRVIEGTFGRIVERLRGIARAVRREHTAQRIELFDLLSRRGGRAFERQGAIELQRDLVQERPVRIDREIEVAIHSHESAALRYPARAVDEPGADVDYQRGHRHGALDRQALPVGIAQGKADQRWAALRSGKEERMAAGREGQPPAAGNRIGRRAVGQRSRALGQFAYDAERAFVLPLGEVERERLGDVADAPCERRQVRHDGFGSLVDRTELLFDRVPVPVGYAKADAYLAGRGLRIENRQAVLAAGEVDRQRRVLREGPSLNAQLRGRAFVDAVREAVRRIGVVDGKQAQFGRQGFVGTIRRLDAAQYDVRRGYPRVDGILAQDGRMDNVAAVAPNVEIVRIVFAGIDEVVELAPGLVHGLDVYAGRLFRSVVVGFLRRVRNAGYGALQILRHVERSVVRVARDAPGGVVRHRVVFRGRIVCEVSRKARGGEYLYGAQCDPFPLLRCDRQVQFDTGEASYERYRYVRRPRDRELRLDGQGQYVTVRQVLFVDGRHPCFPEFLLGEVSQIASDIGNGIESIFACGQFGSKVACRRAEIQMLCGISVRAVKEV